jgi:diaminopimelate decarboxylase
VDHFEYRKGELWCDGVRAEELATTYGTPLYVYCAATIRHHWRQVDSAFREVGLPPLICYSVKAASNLSILRLLGELGSGFDVVSGGELRRVLEAGGDPQKVVYAGVGKTEAEIEQALAAGIRLFNVEAPSELPRIDRLARARGVRAEVALRLNPDVDPGTHRYITTGKRENKFGIDRDRARALLDEAAGLSGVEVTGIHVHLGSQITDVAPYVRGVETVLEFIDSVPGLAARVKSLDLGGGFGIHYRGQEALPAQNFAAALAPLLGGRGLDLILEPGRFIVGNAAVLLARVITVKRSGERTFAICDTGMNDLLRPALYESFHRIAPVVERPGAPKGKTDVVGPICESADFLGLDREMPALVEGELLSVFGAGAYGFAMSSQYNTRARAAEVLVDGDAHRVIRRRETYEDIVGLEREG